MNALIRELFQEAMAHDASDLHLAADSPPTVRIHGEVHALERPPFTSKGLADLVNALLSETQREKLSAEGGLEYAFCDPGGRRYRASIFYEKGNLSAAFRIVPEFIPSREELGLPSVLSQLASRRDGLFIVTGSVGMGKTTTLNWMIDYINHHRLGRIITIEDPIEFVHKHALCTVCQREVGSDCSSFNVALVQALRQDPDVICVGEMRDIGTISTALTAAETGHLVLSTLHTPSAPLTIDRIVDVFPLGSQNQIRTQLANVLIGILSQRLLPRANGGGRVMACEVLIPNTAIGNLIRDGHTALIENQVSLGGPQGMTTMAASIQSLLDKGLITRDVASQYSNLQSFKHFTPVPAAV